MINDNTLESLFYNFLSAGHDEAEVADSIAEALNAAQKRIDEEAKARAAAEEAKRVEEENRTRRTAAMVGMITMYQEYLNTYYPSLGETMEEQEVQELAESMVDMMDGFAEVGKNLKVDLKFTDSTDAAKVSRELDKMFDLFSPFGGKRGLFS